MQECLVPKYVPPTAEHMLRREWAESLRDHLKARGLTRKQFQQLLAEHDLNVTHQAIGSWLRAETMPRLTHQATIARALKVPVRRLFPVEAAA